MVKSERFAGFSGGENRQSEPGNGLFYPWKNTTLTGSRECLSDDVSDDWECLRFPINLKTTNFTRLTLTLCPFAPGVITMGR